MAAEIVKPTRLIAIVGPTAGGKTALAIDAAKRLDGEIVSCDSVQVYRGLDIGSGKPTLSEQAAAPHHLIDILDIDEEMNAAKFAHRAAKAIDEIAARRQVPIVTGGTGLYLTALLKGLFPQGGADDELRARLEVLAERHGSGRLHRLLSRKDPEYAAKTQPADRMRVVRALEIWFGKGRSFSSAQQERKPAFTGEFLIVGLQLDRADLRRRVEERTRRMVEEGLIDETRRALARIASGGAMPRPLRSIGYREVVSRLAIGGLPERGDDDLLRAIVTSTMQYAKRQMTYFRHQFEVEWFSEREAALDRMTSWMRAQSTGETA